MKVYIMPSGWDRELVIKTAFKSGTDKVALVSAYQKKSHTYSKSDTITKEINEYIVKELSKFTKVEIIEVNYINFEDILKQLNSYLQKNEGSEFIINISTGSRMLAATLMFVGFLNNIPIEYSIAENHNPKIMELIAKGEDYHCGFSHLLRIPSINFSLKISPKEKNLLKILVKKGKISVRDFIDGALGNKENQKRSEFNYLCKKLEKQGLVKINLINKRVEAEITTLGLLCYKTEL